MSENRPEWQQGDSPQADKAPEAGQYEQPAYPGSQDQQGSYPYGSYGQQQPDTAGYGQQQPYGQQPPAGYPSYGQQAYPGYAQPGFVRVNPGQSMGLAGLITSFFVPIVGIVLGIIGLKQSRKAGMGNGMAVAGIVVGSVFSLFIVLYIIFIIAIVAAAPEYGY